MRRAEDCGEFLAGWEEDWEVVAGSGEGERARLVAEGEEVCGELDGRELSWTVAGMSSLGVGGLEGLVMLAEMDGSGWWWW